jgi:hypothetical protein
VSNKKNDISQINKYLQGKLDNKAMHQLERDAQDDPFLMDALEGFEKNGADQEANLSVLHNLITNRVANEKKRGVLLWRVLPIAASILIAIGAGYWYLKPIQPKVQYANVVKPDIIKQAPVYKPQAESKIPEKAIASVKEPAKPQLAPTAFKTDTVEYKPSAYTINENSTLDEVIKKMEGMTIDSNGLIAKNGNHVVRARLNGKEFTGGSVQQAQKNLPADILEKIKVIDDYGDQAHKTGALAKRDTSAPKYITQEPIKVFGNNEVQDNPVGNVEHLLQGKVPDTKTPLGKIIITGKLLDAATHEPMAGAIIGTAGKGLAQAGIDGSYKVTVDEGALLVFTNAGYASQMIRLKPGQQNLNVNLLAESRSLSDPVIRGYVKRNKDVNKGTSYITTKEVQDHPIGNVEPLLQGKGTGLIIKNNPAPSVLNTNPYTVTGKVTNGKDGSPMKGASISIGTKELAKTDINGKFKVNVPAGDTIIVSYPKYISKSAKIDRPYDLIVILVDDGQQH